LRIYPAPGDPVKTDAPSPLTYELYAARGVCLPDIVEKIVPSRFDTNSSGLLTNRTIETATCYMCGARVPRSTGATRTRSFGRAMRDGACSLMRRPQQCVRRSRAQAARMIRTCPESSGEFGIPPTRSRPPGPVTRAADSCWLRCHEALGHPGELEAW